MRSPHAHLATELEALVMRAARQGRLDPYELLDTYQQMAPSSHAELGNSRKLDVGAVVTALTSLPTQFVFAPRVLVVPRLAAFSHQPVASGNALAGALEDGTLLIEARLGHASLMALVSAVCALAHELDKARLLAPPPDEAFAALKSDDDAEEEVLVQIGASRRAAPSAADTADSDGFEATAAGGDEEQAGELDERHSPNAAPPQQDGEDTLAPALTLAQLAFALGVDESTLRSANTQTAGALLHMLEPLWELPEIALHADLDAAPTALRVTKRSHQVLNALAEMGLLGRPLHLWLGSPIFTDCLSPYTRELRQVLVEWARGHADALGGDVDLDGTLAEDSFYALAYDFLASDERLFEERKEADRSVGIMHYEADDQPFELIDLGRVEPGACDARLTPWEALREAPILVRLAVDAEAADGESLAALLTQTAQWIASVTVQLDGSAIVAPPGTVILPDVLIRWAGEQKVAVPGSQQVSNGDFAGLAQQVEVGGSILSVCHAGLLSAANVGQLVRSYNVHAVEVGGGGSIVALADAVWSGQLGPEVELAWATVAAHYLPSGRPGLASLGGQAAVAISRLRRILAALAPPPPPRARRERPKGPSSGRTVRIKA